MTENDRSLFQKANIEPPCNVNADYMNRLFKLPPFCEFFVRYVNGGRLTEHYLIRAHE